MAGAVKLVLLWAPAIGSFISPSGSVICPASSSRSAATVFCNAAPSGDGPLAMVDFESTLSRFAPAAELPTLRTKLSELQEKLQDAVASQNFASAALLRDEVMELRSMDPASVASSLRGELEAAVADEKYDVAAKCRDELLVLRRFLPQYQLAGLWKGNYPNHGDETVRIHYDGDLLMATKVTGDAHVPAGEITFRADLAIPFDEQNLAALGGEEALGVRVEVVSVSNDGDQQQRDVEQFIGEGRIAARGFLHAHYVPGQLFLMDDDVVGFLWLPLGTFVVFSRVHEEAEEGTVCSSDLAAAAAAAYGEKLIGSHPLDPTDGLLDDEEDGQRDGRGASQ